MWKTTKRRKDYGNFSTSKCLSYKLSYYYINKLSSYIQLAQMENLPKQLFEETRFMFFNTVVYI